MAEEPDNMDVPLDLYRESLKAMQRNPQVIERAREFLNQLQEQVDLRPSSEESFPHSGGEGGLPSSPVAEEPLAEGQGRLFRALSVSQPAAEEPEPFTESTNPPGVSVQRTPGAVVATLSDTSDPRPEPKAAGVPFGPVCTGDRTFVSGDVSFVGGNPPSFEKVQDAARRAFEGVASFDPRSGADMTRIEDAMKTTGEKSVVSVLAISNDPRCP